MAAGQEVLGPANNKNIKMPPRTKIQKARGIAHFQPGHDVRRCRPKADDFQDSQRTAKNYGRLPKEIFEAMDCTDMTTATVLRPADASKSLLEEVSSTDHPTVEGNRVIEMSRLSAVMSATCNQHGRVSPNCKQAEFTMPADLEMRMGLGTVVGITCINCHYTYRAKFYTEIPGSRAPKVNAQLGAALTKCAVSYGDVRLLLATLDIPPVSEKCLASHVNKMSPLWADVNKRDMSQNCEILKKVLQHRGGEEDSTNIIAMGDTVYNNPPKGRAMSQPGTMSCTPLLEGETSLHLPIALTTYSKLCHLGVKCNGNHPGCQANYPVHRPMGNSEKAATSSNILQVQETGLKVAGLITDGTAKTYNIPGVNTEKLHCCAHLSRGQARKVRGLDLCEQTIGSKEKTTVSRFKKTLARALTRRCTMELFAAKRRHGTGGPAFLAAVESARRCILKCFHGLHQDCQKTGVCKATDKTTPSYLPNNRYLTDTSYEDLKSLQNAIDYRLEKLVAIQQRHMKTTNAVEALHLRTLKLCPKYKTYKRNFRYRAHSAVNSQTHGHCASLYAFCERFRCAPVNTLQMMAMQKKEKYWHLRRRSHHYRARRNKLSREKWTLQQFSCMNIENGVADEDTILDHNY